MTVVKIALQVMLVLSSLFLTLLILMHKGKGGGLSDMFGGGMSSSLGGSTIAALDDEVPSARVARAH